MGFRNLDGTFSEEDRDLGPTARIENVKKRLFVDDENRISGTQVSQITPKRFISCK